MCDSMSSEFEHLVGRKVLDADEQIAGERAEAGRQPRIGGIGDGLEAGEARRFKFVPVDHARFPLGHPS